MGETVASLTKQVAELKAQVSQLLKDLSYSQENGGSLAKVGDTVQVQNLVGWTGYVGKLIDIDLGAKIPTAEIELISSRGKKSVSRTAMANVIRTTEALSKKS